MNNWGEHTFCNCLECDQEIEAFRILIVGRRNWDPDLELALIHFLYTDDTSYNVFGELYLICHPLGAIVDPQLWEDDDDDDDEDWDPEDGKYTSDWSTGLSAIAYDFD